MPVSRNLAALQKHSQLNCEIPVHVLGEGVSSFHLGPFEEGQDMT